MVFWSPTRDATSTGLLEGLLQHVEAVVVAKGMVMPAMRFAFTVLCVAVASGFAPSRPGGAAPAARRDGRAAVAVAAAVESLSVSPIAKVGGVVRLPGSKSLSNRALLIAALCEGETTVENLLASDDTERMPEALAAMGKSEPRERLKRSLPDWQHTRDASTFLESRVSHTGVAFEKYIALPSGGEDAFQEDRIVPMLAWNGII